MTKVTTSMESELSTKDLLSRYFIDLGWFKNYDRIAEHIIMKRRTAKDINFSVIVNKVSIGITHVDNKVKPIS